MKLTCIGKDLASRDFDLSITTNEDGYPYFQAYLGSKVYGFFRLILKPKDAGSHMVMLMEANGYEQHGVPEAIIPFAAKYLSTVIHSSPSMAIDTWRTEAASKAWDRLVAAGKAIYSKETDTYRTI